MHENPFAKFLKGEKILEKIEGIVSSLEESNADKLEALREYESGNTYHNPEHYSYERAVREAAGEETVVMDEDDPEAVDLGHIEATVID